MKTTQESVSVLNDLIEINNDRIAGFEKAIADINDENIDLKALFQEYATQSRKFSQELSGIVGAYGEEVETGNSVSGTLHRAWIDVKSLFGGSDRASLLSEAERGEDAIVAAYRKALTEEWIPVDAIDQVRLQAEEIKSAHDTIKSLRDAAKVAQ